MKKYVIYCIFATSLFIAGTQAIASTVSCPNLPKGNYSYGQSVNGWYLWLGQSGNLVLTNDFIWAKQSGNYKGIRYIYSISPDASNNDATCNYFNADGSQRFELINSSENFKCSRPWPSSPENCMTNSFDSID